MSERNISTATATKLITVCMASKRPVFLWGPPGIGKSDLMVQIGQSFEVKGKDGEVLKKARPVVDMRLLLMDPTDLKGIPFFDPELNTMRWAPANELPTKENGMENAILFLDEMNAAPPSVQAAAYQLILNRRIGEYILPDGVDIVAAGNRESDRGVTYKMPSPLANRFVHLNMEANFEEWQAWAIDNNVHEDIVGFLSKHSQHLFNFDPKSPDKAFATPRSWAFCGSILTDAVAVGLSEGDQTTLIAGTIGEGLAIEFAQHRKFAAQLPDPIEVLKGNVRELKVKEVSAHFSLVISLCYRLKELSKIAESSADTRPEQWKDLDVDKWHTYVDNFIKYMLDTLQPEMVILGARTALKDFKLPIQHRKLLHFTTLYTEYGDMVLGS